MLLGLTAVLVGMVLGYAVALIDRHLAVRRRHKTVLGGAAALLAMGDYPLVTPPQFGGLGPRRTGGNFAWFTDSVSGEEGMTAPPERTVPDADGTRTVLADAIAPIGIPHSVLQPVRRVAKCSVLRTRRSRDDVYGGVMNPWSDCCVSYHRVRWQLERFSPGIVGGTLKPTITNILRTEILMLSHHAILDRTTAWVTSRFIGDTGFFKRSVDSPRVEEMLPSIKLTVPEIGAESIFELTAETPVGVLDPAIQVWQWLGPEYPTIVYHHGNGEHPFSTSRFATNTFRDIFTNHSDRFSANLLVIRAPFHDGSTREYIQAMEDLSYFVAMLATSVVTIERLVNRLHEHGRSPIIVSGTSLGGWVTNLHRTYCGSADAYVPMLAGAALGDVFVNSSYRHLLGTMGNQNPEAVRRTLNFEQDFAENESLMLFPLLAHDDQYIEYDVQRTCYDGFDVEVLDRGHITSVLNPKYLREHVASVLDHVASETPVDSRGPTDGSTIIFVHGAGISRKLWLPQTESLSDRYRTVAPDLPGHGVRTNEPFDFEKAVETVEAIIQNSRSECVVLVGHSLGGYVSIEAAIRNSDRVSGLVLSGSSADYRGWLRIQTTIGSHLQRLGSRSQLVNEWFEGRIYERLQALPLSDGTADRILDSGLSLDAWGQAGLSLVGQDFPSRLGEYGGPVLLINGENDRLNRPAAVERTAEITDGIAVVVRNAGHTVNLERPDIYTAVVSEFVASVCEGGSVSLDDVF